jgi:hypothetical protein
MMPQFGNAKGIAETSAIIIVFVVLVSVAGCIFRFRKVAA